MILSNQLELLLDEKPVSITPLSGGQIGQVYKVKLEDGTWLVAKTSDNSLLIEAHMLRYLKAKTDLPVPEVIKAGKDILVLEFMNGSSQFTPASEKHAATLLANLHSLSREQFGFEQDTLIGSLRQPNPLTTSWIDFFAEQRLLYMLEQNARQNKLPKELVGRLERLANQLENYLPESKPALIHGDVWAANVLCKNNKVTAFLDPALYYGHAEVELAYINLFGTFGQDFFEQYNTLNPIDKDFWKTRQHIYALYPLLVHVYYFGGSYVNAANEKLISLLL